MRPAVSAPTAFRIGTFERSYRLLQPFVRRPLGSRLRSCLCRPRVLPAVLHSSSFLFALAKLQQNRPSVNTFC